MATTYTTNYNLGKQENHADKFDMDVITNNADKIDAALTGLQSGIDGKQATLTTDQLAAVNSGITAEKLAQDENNILFNAQQGVTNVATVTSGTYTATSGMRYTSIPLSTTLTGDITVVIGGLSSTATGTQCAVQLTDATTTLWQTTATRGSNIVLSAHIDSPATKLNIYCGASYQTTSSGDTVTWTDLMVCPTSLYTGTYQPYAMSNAELTNGVGRLGYTIEVVTLSNVTISKTSAGIFYTSAIDVSDKFDLLLGATLNNFGNLQSNIAIMPAVKPTAKTYSLWICDSTNPATLPVVANTQIQVVLFGITK